MAIAPNLVVAGDPGVARRLRETGRFPVVHDVASAAELRDLSRSGSVHPPAAFVFAPGFSEDLPGAGVTTLANGLVGSGFTVLVHGVFAERDEELDPRVRVAARQMRLSDLLATLDGAASVPAQVTEPAEEAPAASNGWPRPSHAYAGQMPAAPGDARRGQVVAVTSAKGGVGKTSLTVNLAVYAARLMQAAGRAGSVALLDTNFQQADVGRYLNMPGPTIMDLIRNPATLSAQKVRHHMAHIAEIDLYALLGPPDAVNADPAMINSELYGQILRVLREAFDFVFIDTPVAELYHTTFTELILPAADAILVPVEPNRVTLESAKSWLTAITLPYHSRGGGVDPDKLSLILNRARADVDCGPEDVLDLLPGWRLIGMVPEDQEWMQAANRNHLLGLRVSAELDATFRGILQFVTAEPAFGTATIQPPTNGHPSRWRKLLGL